MGAFRFRIHYSLEEAQALLPRVTEWLRDLGEREARLKDLDQRLKHLLSQGGDAGGESVEDWLGQLVARRRLYREFERREIQLKDLERGLVDFPALIGGREVFLCWELGEDQIEHWHDLDGGFAGRERLT